MTIETDLHRAFGRMEGKIDALLLNSAEIKQTLDDHDGRIKALEDAATERRGITKAARIGLPAAAALLGAAGAKVAGLLGLAP